MEFIVGIIVGIIAGFFCVEGYEYSQFANWEIEIRNPKYVQYRKFLPIQAAKLLLADPMLMSIGVKSICREYGIEAKELKVETERRIRTITVYVIN